MSDYVTPTELLNSGEDVREIVTESQDYVPYELLEPTHGDVKYISKSREVKISKPRYSEKLKQSYLSIELSVSELEDAAGETIKLSRPLRTWINTLQFSRRNRPGTTSNASDYLIEAGFSPKELSGEGLVEALNESSAIPLEAIVGWVNRTKRLSDGPPPVYEEEKFFTKDFNRGTKEEPNYVPNFVDDETGEEVTARHRLVAFRRIR